MILSDFSSVLRALTGMDAGDLGAVLPGVTPGDVRRFEADPGRFFLRLCDERAEALWRAMAERTRVPLFPDAARALAWTGDGGELRPVGGADGHISAVLDGVACELAGVAS